MNYFLVLTFSWAGDDTVDKFLWESKKFVKFKLNFLNRREIG